MLKKKIWVNFEGNIELFTQKLSLGFQKYAFGIRDPRSGKNPFRIPDPGVKKAPDTGSLIRTPGIREKPIPDPGSSGQKGTRYRIPDPDPQHWLRDEI
jgi:hypothetical protein